MTEDYDTDTNSLRAPAEISDRNRTSGQFTNSSPIILQTP